MGRAAYGELAAVYDRVYSSKDYRREASVLRGLARRFGPRPLRRWVDVACGTGEHLRFLAPHFAVEGVDASPAMLALARRKLPSVPFRRARMESFRLDAPADVVSCLFSAIGYLKDDRALERAGARFYGALRPGGVAFIEPWIEPRAFRRGRIGYVLYRRPSELIVRVNTISRRGDVTEMDEHYLISDGRSVRHAVEHHRLRMVPHSRLAAIFRRAGFRVLWLPEAMPLRRGLLVAVRPGGRDIPPRTAPRRTPGR
jgi:SAM-dependent methyltransferase